MQGSSCGLRSSLSGTCGSRRSSRARAFQGARYYNWCKLDSEGFTEYLKVSGTPNCFLINHESASQRKRDRDEFEHNAIVDAMLDHPATFNIVDEVHKLQSKSASRTEGITKVSRACKYRLGMTGTPGLPHHLWAQLHYIDPRIFPVALTAFNKRYIKEIGVGHIVYKREYPNKGELRTRMGNYSIRRTQAEVLPHLPQAVHEVERIPLKPEQQKMYDELVEETLTYFDDHPITKSSASARTHALRNITGGHVKQDLGQEGKKKLYKKHR
ncbi:MAG: SNF2-related protein, partial [Planctomycetota bacterium]